MAELERYLDVEGKYAWRVKKKVDDIVEEVSSEDLPKEVQEAEKSSKKNKSKRKK